MHVPCVIKLMKEGTAVSVLLVRPTSVDSVIFGARHTGPPVIDERAASRPRSPSCSASVLYRGLCMGDISASDGYPQDRLIAYLKGDTL